MPALKSKGSRPGPRLTKPKKGEKATVSVRLDPQTKALLNRAADTADRSLSQEAEIRLMQTFHDERQLPHLLTLRYGNQLAGLLLLLGEVMRSAGQRSAFDSRAERSPMSAEELDLWWSDPYSYDQAAQAAAEVLDAIRPAGDPDLLGRGARVEHRFRKRRGRDVAAGTLLALREGRGKEDWYLKVATLLGELVRNIDPDRLIAPDQTGDENAR